MREDQEILRGFQSCCAAPPRVVRASSQFQKKLSWRTIRESSSGQTLFVQSWLPCLCDQLLYGGLLFLGQLRIQPQ